MKILIVANHFSVCSARYAADAFVRLGHDVRHVGPAMGRRIWGMDVPQEYVWTPDELVQLKPVNSGYRLVEEADWGIDYNPDLIIFMDSDPAILEWGEKMPFSVPMIVWGVDNHVRDYRRPCFDHYFLAHRNVSVMVWEAKHVASEFSEQMLDVLTPSIKRGDPLRMKLGGTYPEPDMTHLPCCYDPIHFTPSPIPYTERAYDVCMIGVMYPERWKLVNELKAAGIKVLAGTGLIYETYRDAYHNARISLCVSSNGDVAQRVFETAAMGCVIVSDKCPDFDILQPLGIWTIEPDVSIVEQIQGILADPVKAQEQIALSQAWAIPHTWDARARVIVEWWEANHA